ncbi:MAG: DUF4369 domain-containing protein [Bacteroidaceae bacterium]|nr:DUF4369 domain-containing protein [Bacteroidaceae bacterium]
MKRNIFLLIISALLLTACGEEKDVFVIKGQLNNLGGMPLYAVYQSPTGVVVDTMRPLDGKIEMRGSSPDVVPVQLYTIGWQPFMRLYMSNENRVEIKGDATQLYDIELKGSSLNRQLWRFICDNRDIFDEAAVAAESYQLNKGRAAEYDKKTARLDSLLTDYIVRHNNKEMSAILIGDYLLRYDNYALCDSLWQQLDEKARLPYIEETIERLREQLIYNEDNSQIPHLRYIDNADTLVYVNTRKSKATLLCLWEASAPQADVKHKVLEHYARKYSNEELQIVALSFDCDTAVWHRVVDNDTTRVIDMWGDAIYTSKILSKHHVTRMPVYMLGDSLGNILVRTPQLPDEDIDMQIDSLVTIPQYKIEKPIFKL